jgi:hypothetical protein
MAQFPNDVSSVVWALFHLCWPSLAVIGYCGPSWACVGRRWLLCNKNKIKNLYIKKITYLVWPKRCVWHRLGPFSCCPSKVQTPFDDSIHK